MNAFKKGTGYFSPTKRWADPSSGGSGRSSLSLFLLLVLFASGCSPVSYPEARCTEALREIALKEYKIPHIDVEFVGTTLGVFLPLDQLFAADLKEALMSGKVTDMESLFQPTEEAIDKVEDILFSMSRVMLSTDKKIEFYYLQATDTEKSGMDMTFIGQIDDLKRVRFWDIPRSEYRKRILHDLHMNRAALWHRPVRHFFKDLNQETAEVVQSRYFPGTAQDNPHSPSEALKVNGASPGNLSEKESGGRDKWAREFFFTDAVGRSLPYSRAEWTLLDVRSIPIQDNEIVVYAKVQAAPKDPRDTSVKPVEKEYLFQVSMTGDTEKISRIIPMAHLDDKVSMPDFTFTREMVTKSLPNWETEFKTPDITMGDFLARQLTRRFQSIAAEDERVYNTFTSVKLVVRFEAKPDPRFTIDLTAPLRGKNEVAYSPAKGLHEDIVYLWTLLAREFVDVLRSYSFQAFQSLQFQIFEKGQLQVWTAIKEDLELFRRHKKDLASILRFSQG